MVVDSTMGPPGRTHLLSVPEIRDYQLINKELARLLAAGATRIVLSSVEGQRLLASRLRGAWLASIVVDGRAGSELGAELDAPGLTLVATGDVADGSGCGLVSGRIEILGDATDCLGYCQRGGTIVVRGDAGNRAGLLQRGGMLIVAGRLGRLAAEGQRGGRFAALRVHSGPHAGIRRIGGQLIWLEPNRLPRNASIEELEQAVADSEADIPGSRRWGASP